MKSDESHRQAIDIKNLDSSSTYYVINHGFGAYLKLGNKKDGYGDRKAYIHEGDRGGDDGRYQWQIVHDQSDDTYSFLNSSGSGGFLFEGGQKDSDGDYTIWGHASGSIDNSKGDRYKFKLSEVDGGGHIYHIRTISGHIVKGGNHIDGDDDHQVYGQPSSGDGDRFQWVIVQVP